MQNQSILIIGGGIGGLTAAIALCRGGHTVEIIEKDPEWSVYGVGIIQQFNVIRAMASIDLLDAYMAEAYGFDVTTMFDENGRQIAQFETPRLAGPQYPSNAGIRRPALQKVLADRAQEHSAKVRLGVTAEELNDDGTGVSVRFSDGTSGRYDIVIGADGLYSRTRAQIMPDAPAPRYTGQWVWRYNLPQPKDEPLEGIRIYFGNTHSGLTPLGPGLMYVFLLSEEPADYRLEPEDAVAAMRERLAPAPAPIADLAPLITKNEDVVGRPLEVVFLYGDWHKGRVVLLGDAVHAATPHLAQGAGMAIEDAIVVAEEIGKNADPEAAFVAYRSRRFERAKFIAENSIRIGDSQMGKVPPFDVGALNRQTIALMAEPI